MLSLLLASFVIQPILAYTLQNVTIDMTDPSIIWLPSCVRESQVACDGGAWWKDNDNYPTNNTVMVCGDPQHEYNGNSEPYMAYSFTGSAFYVYEWLNTSTAVQQFLHTDGTNTFLNLTQNAPEFTSVPLSGTLQLVLAWSLTGLDPTQQTTVGIQHYATSGRNTYLALDHFVVTQTMGLVEPATNRRVGLSKGAVAGVVVGVVLSVLLSIWGLCKCLTRRRLQRNVAHSHKPFGATLSVGSRLATMRGAAPTRTNPQNVHIGETELERSERLAKEGMLEEAMEKPSSIA
ncbi:hypothetical protein FRB96_005105 [Tulasnella sp. 330]|nr:hypothetical protein FRB96_005105 [Tulasnella sp. 330]KAG8881476.1 hypothetical protein FRB97_009530 [Tulasnella sp. 331]KAG8887585.1 hypothetical protein FRB98_009427 [Tulasnella sp. 332]